MAKAKKQTTRNEFNKGEGSPDCCECSERTPHIYKGKRYCAKHHPDPGANIRQPKRSAA